MAKNKTTPKAERPTMVCHTKVTHNSIDTISGKRKISMYVNVKDDTGPIASGVNLNFSNMDDDKYDRLLMLLGIDKFTERTPLVMTLSVPEGSLLSDWKENMGKEAEKIANDQTTLGKDDKDAK